MSTGLKKSSMPLLIESDDYLEQGLELKKKYGFNIINSVGELNGDTQSFLVYDVGGLSLSNASNNKERVQVDFLKGRSGYRLSTMINTAQPVLKAIGFNKDRIGLKVLDATAGLGVDGMIMATAGCSVMLLEKSTIMVAMLEDGFRRVAEDIDATELEEIVVRRVQLKNIDSIEYFPKIIKGEYDVIYLDPMFPERKKSSKVKKEMQLAKFVADDEDNAHELLAAALQTPVKRIVIKRPLKAPLLKKGFSAQIKGKSIRFDIFLR